MKAFRSCPNCGSQDNEEVFNFVECQLCGYLCTEHGKTFIVGWFPIMMFVLYIVSMLILFVRYA